MDEPDENHTSESTELPAISNSQSASNCAKWTEMDEGALVDCLWDAHNQGWQMDSRWKSKTWTAVAKAMPLSVPLKTSKLPGSLATCVFLFICTFPFKLSVADILKMKGNFVMVGKL